MGSLTEAHIANAVVARDLNEENARVARSARDNKIEENIRIFHSLFVEYIEGVEFAAQTARRSLCDSYWHIDMSGEFRGLRLLGGSAMKDTLFFNGNSGRKKTFQTVSTQEIAEYIVQINYELSPNELLQKFREAIVLEIEKSLYSFCYQNDRVFREEEIRRQRKEFWESILVPGLIIITAVIFAVAMYNGWNMAWPLG